MKFSKFKKPLLGLMIVGVLSLNVFNPLKPKLENDAKGLAKQMNFVGGDQTALQQSNIALAAVFLLYTVLNALGQPSSQAVGNTVDGTIDSMAKLD